MNAVTVAKVEVTVGQAVKIIAIVMHCVIIMVTVALILILLDALYQQV